MCVFVCVFSFVILFKRVGGSGSSISIENNVCTYFVCVFLNFVICV